jgi:hypothetical protein
VNRALGPSDDNQKSAFLTEHIFDFAAHVSLIPIP